MISNVSKSTMVIGRFRVLPNGSLPAVELTKDETDSVKQFLKKGFLKEDGRTATNPIFAAEKTQRFPSAAADGRKADAASAPTSAAPATSAKSASTSSTKSSKKDTAPEQPAQESAPTEQSKEG